MPQGDVEVVRRLFECTNERDWQGALDCYADDVVLGVHLTAAGDVALGKPAVSAWFRDWFRSFDSDYHFEIDEVRDLGAGQVLMIATHHGRGRATGAPINHQGAWIYVLRDGKIVRCDGYPTAEDAMRAIDLIP